MTTMDLDAHMQRMHRLANRIEPILGDLEEMVAEYRKSAKPHAPPPPQPAVLPNPLQMPKQMVRPKGGLA